MTERNTLPPEPTEPTELDAFREMLKFANQAVFNSDAGAHQAAAQAFYCSWQAMVRHMLTDTVESENRRLAWQRAEALESRLEEIRALVTAETVVDAPDFLPARIREVLDR
jgi:hypothetical protein